ncbi:MAG: hypothetical protein PF961_09285 [Planctomycetota bacterium]|jgi:hypothetical protein|nr:hypothetical protein [Planctomycetota bacterium]
MTTASPTHSLPCVTDGELLLYRLFEIADDIDVVALRCLKMPHATRLRPNRISVFGSLREVLLVIDLGECQLPVDDGSIISAPAELILFTFGVAAVCWRVGLGNQASASPSPVPWADLAGQATALSRSAAITDTAAELIRTWRPILNPALVRPIEWPAHESYMLVRIFAFEREVTPDEMRVSPDLARLLLGEPQHWRPANTMIQRIAQSSISYSDADLVVVEWDAAIELTNDPGEDVPHLLAMSLALALEFQRFDSILEQELNDLYNHGANLAAGTLWGRTRRSRRALSRIHRLQIDVANFVDRSENALKLVEDIHYARIYKLAIERMHVATWRAAVERRQKVIGEFSIMVHEAAQTGIAHALEFIIMLLIMWEIIAAFLH